jgi:hypothetical protein
MAIKKNLILAGFVVCFISSLASADSIPISGVAYHGNRGSIAASLATSLSRGQVCPSFKAHLTAQA